MNKKIIIPALTIVIGGGLLYGASQVAAHGFGSRSGNESVVTRFAEAFGKSEDEVRAVFDQLHEEHQAEMMTTFEERLSQAVADGTLTDAQKQLILDKHEELMADKESSWETYKDMTPQERRAAMQAKHDELEAWAEKNGIDLDFLGGFGRKMGMHGGHGGFGEKFGKSL